MLLGHCGDSYSIFGSYSHKQKKGRLQPHIWGCNDQSNIFGDYPMLTLALICFGSAVYLWVNDIPGNGGRF
jgi:hypothetical protein